MKQVQIDRALDSITVDAAADGESVNVSDVGPLTVAVQLSISNSATPSGFTAQIQGSLDGENFFDIGDALAISGDGQFCVTDTAVAFAHYRVAFAIDSGSADVVQRVFVYGQTI